MLLNVNVIRSLIEQRGVEYTEFAKRIGMSKAGLYRMFKTGTTKSVTLHRISKELGTSAIELLLHNQITMPGTLDIPRLKKMVESKFDSHMEFSRKLGVSWQGLQGIYKNKSTKLSTVKRIAALLGVTPESLFEGAYVVPESNDVTSYPPLNVSFVPANLHDTFFIERVGNIRSIVRFHLPELMPGEFYAFTVTGESMAPTIRSGDIVVCLKLTDAAEIKPNAVHVLFDKTEGLVVKRLEVKGKKIRCVSDNEDYPPYDIEAASVKDIYRVRRVITSNI